MSPTSCHCSTPRWNRETDPSALLSLPGCGLRAAASPPTQLPAQYSPALPWGTTRFGMELGGSMALSATHTPERISCIIDAQPGDHSPITRRRDELCVPVIDRKSTRLNSSHANISYAVL